MLYRIWLRLFREYTIWAHHGFKLFYNKLNYFNLSNLIKDKNLTYLNQSYFMRLNRNQINLNRSNFDETKQEMNELYPV